MEDIKIEQRDYYAILGLPRTATAEEIKRQYRTLSRQFHPDKQSLDLQDFANEYFHRIDRAYQVLIDEEKRKLYDAYGEKAVSLYENNEEIVKRDDSLDSIDDLIHSIYQRELEVKAGQNSSFSLQCDLSHLLHPTESPSFYPQPPSSILSTIQISQSVQALLSSQDTLVLTGSATVANSAGMGVAAVAFRHAFSPMQMVTLSTVFGSRQVLAFDMTQNFSSSSQGGMSFSLEGKEGSSIGIFWNKQFGNHLVGSLKFNIARALGCNLALSYRDESKTDVKLFVGNDLGVSFSHLRPMKFDKSLNAKMKLAVSLSNLEVETMGGKVLSPFSKVNLNMISSFTGVSLKLKYQRGSMVFVLPVLLSKKPFDPLGISIGAAVYAISAGIMWLWRNTEAGRRAEQKREEEERHRLYLREHSRLAAVSQQEMMRNYAKSIQNMESKKKGLVILYAVYGDETAIGVPEKVKAMQGALDVTVALQFMVKDSKLRLYAGSKKEYMGFCNLAEEGRKVKLYVRYSFNGFVYEVEVEDLEPLYLPAFRATLLGNENEVCCFVCFQLNDLRCL